MRGGAQCGGSGAGALAWLVPGYGPRVTTPSEGLPMTPQPVRVPAESWTTSAWPEGEGEGEGEDGGEGEGEG